MLTGKNMKRVAAILAIVGLLPAVLSYAQTDGNEPVVDTGGGAAVPVDPWAGTGADHEDPADYVWDSAEVVPIVLYGDTISIGGAGATADGSTVTITRGGTYSLSGILADGQIIVDSQDKKTVRLILAGADIRCSWSAPLLVENAKKTIIVLADGTENYAADGRSGTHEGAPAEEPNAVIFSKDDLTIWGAGSLTVCGDVNDGIVSKDGLILAGGTIDVEVVDDGIRGKDYLVVRGGTITVNAGGDGLRSDNETDPNLGYISLEAATLSVTSGADAVQAETDVLIADGAITLAAGGGSNLRTVANRSAKGISAGVSAFIGGGYLAIDSADDAIHSNGSLAVYGGTFVLSSLDDALHADAVVDVNSGDIDVTKCYEGIDANTITIEGGSLRIVASDDGIVAGKSLSILAGVIDVVAGADALSAKADLRIAAGKITLSSGGGSAKTVAATSAKGIKGVGSVVIDGGDFTVNSADDAIHSNGDITINGGTFALWSGDDGMHADANLVINDGDIRIAKSYEGLESANANITINGGIIHIVSSDDGINVAGGGDAMAAGGPGGAPGGVPGGQPGVRPGQGGAVAPPAAAAGNYWLYINGGYLAIDALGDGIDSNGSIAMTDGVVLVNGPTANDNGALDHSSFPMTGGFLVAAGSSGMAQTTSTTSTQCSILLTFNTTLPAGTLVHLQDSQGQDLLTFAPTKQYSSVAFSSPDLVQGSTYDVYYGGTCTGTVVDGLYQDGTYTPGTKYTTFTITTTVTNVGTGTTPGTPVTPGGRR
jgi:hypothetical protein